MVMLRIYRGIPASGKTTDAKAWVDEDPANRSRISRDDIRINYFNMPANRGVLDSHGESRVTKVQRELVETFLLTGVSTAVDDTNLRQNVAQSWADLAVILKVDFEVIDFTDVPVEECIRRDILRGARGERAVGEKVIRDMHTRYLLRGPLGTVEARSNGVVSRQYVPDPTLPKAYIFDVDGTLSLMDRNLRSPYEWHKVHLDTVNVPVYNLYKALSVEHEIIVMSGRDSACRGVTEQWLKDNDISYQGLFMRAKNDNRKDSVVKSELFWNHVAPFWQVMGSVDDRSQVVSGTWRAMNLLCMQIAPGDF